MSTTHINTSRKITKTSRVSVRDDSPDNDTRRNEYEHKRRLLQDLQQRHFPLTIFSTRRPWGK
jgi:hypothetical protein